MAYEYVKRPAEAAKAALQTGPAALYAAQKIPNSAMLSLHGMQDRGGDPNLAGAMQARLAALRRQIPSAEEEADRLSAGVRARTPDALRQEMGQRLGADFSAVRFHSDAGSAAKAEHMGARAWTQGSDVYFGEGGFDPAVAAHEMVHTVQQGAVAGAASVQSVPMGTAQMLPWWMHLYAEDRQKAKEEKANKRADKMFKIMAGLKSGDPNAVSKKDQRWLNKKLASNSSTLMQTLMDRRDSSAADVKFKRDEMAGADADKMDYDASNTASAYDMNIYNALTEGMRGNAENTKFADAEQKNQAKQAANGTATAFDDAKAIVRNTNYAHTAQGQAEVQRRQQAFRQRGSFIYQNYDRALDNPEDESILDDWMKPNAGANAANPQPAAQYEHRKKKKNQNKLKVLPFEVDMDKARKENRQYNPTQSRKLGEIQRRIDNAGSAEEAYRIFAEYTGNNQAELRDSQGNAGWKIDGVDLEQFKKKMKNMSRMIHDYPELKGMIGNLTEDTRRGVAMSARSTKGMLEKADISYNPNSEDAATPEGAQYRREKKKRLEREGRNAYDAASGEYDGNHEMGHVLNSFLFKNKSEADADTDWNKNQTASNMLMKVAKKVLPQKQLQKLKFHKTDSSSFDKGQIDTTGSGANQLGLTSGYGQQDAGEFFAEAFADVYEHGNKARPASIELLKLYEKERKDILNL